jgi:histidinol phosphatase-like enzyme (inositol monophosphatase family)
MPKRGVVDDRLIQDALRVARLGGEEALRWFRGGFAVQNKVTHGFDPVTEADRAAETVMRAAIEQAHPDHAIVGEELGEKPGGAWRWVLDPIDGTRGFLCGTPTWTTLVAIERDTVPVVGVILQPFTDETWVGSPGGTQLLRGSTSRWARCSQVERLAAARLATTDPRPLPHGYFEPPEADAFAVLACRARVVRFGHDAYAYGLLASGHVDLVIEAGLKHHDVAALEPVVRGAGALYADWSGGAGRSGSRIAAAATPALMQEALELLAAAGV